MGYFNEFPHTKTYDGDLGYLIKMYKELVEYTRNIEKVLTNNLEAILNEYLNEGELFVNAVYTPETEDLKFIFTKVGG